MVGSRVVVVITGASSGVGRALSIEMSKNPLHHIVLVARDRQKLKEVKKNIAALGGSVDYFSADVAIKDDILALTDFIRDAFGKVNILVNNAGVGIFKPLIETEEEEWLLMNDTMVYGTFLACKYLIPLMLKTKPDEKRHIVINSSYWGLEGKTPRCTAYIAAKFAQRGLSLSLREELRKENVKVTCLLPGSIDTPFFETGEGWSHDPDRILNPVELAGAINDILKYRGNLNVEEVVIQAIDPD